MSEKSAWSTIWVHPRATIRRIVTENKKQSLWLLATIYGFSALLGTFQSFSIGSVIGVIPIFILAVIFAPIWGYIAFAIWSWLVLWTGKWLKGLGDFQSVRAAYAWSCVPIAVSDLIWIVMLVMFGSTLFAMQPTAPLFSQAQTIVLLVLLFGKVIFSIWSLVIYLNTLAEVQQFSVLRAIGNVIIAGLFVAIIIGIVSALSLYFLGAPLEQSAPTGAAFQMLQEGRLMYSQAI